MLFSVPMADKYYCSYTCRHESKDYFINNFIISTQPAEIFWNLSICFFPLMFTLCKLLFDEAKYPSHLSRIRMNQKNYALYRFIPFISPP
jgi:hypothetical protein